MNPHPGDIVEKGKPENGTYELGFVLEAPEGSNTVLVCWQQPYGSVTRWELVSGLVLQNERA